MNQLKIQIQWKHGEGPTSKEAAGKLSQIRHGVPGLRSDGGRTTDNYLEFDDQFWSRAKGYVWTITSWLQEHGVSHWDVTIDGYSVEDFLEHQLRALRPLIAEAAVRENSTRRMWPSDKAKERRESLERALSNLTQVLGEQSI